MRITVNGLERLEDLRIRNLRVHHKKIADLRPANLHTSEMCGFAIAEGTQENSFPSEIIYTAKNRLQLQLGCPRNKQK